MSATIDRAPQPTTVPPVESFQVISATPNKGGGQLKFYCPGCRSQHLHGRPDPGTDMTRYRASHCFDPDSVFYDATYELVEVAPGDPRLIPTPGGRRPRSRKPDPALGTVLACHQSPQRDANGGVVVARGPGVAGCHESAGKVRQLSCSRASCHA